MKHIILFLIIFYSQHAIAQDGRYDVCPLKVGEGIPEGSVLGQEDKIVTLSELVADKPTVLVFYRGAWCGYCIKHLAELNAIKEDVEKLGYQIAGITIDKPEKLSISNEKSNSEIVVYSDSSTETIKAFGLAWKVEDSLFDKYKNEYNLDLEDWSGEKHHALPVPAIFVVKESKIEFQYVNPDHSKRLKAETLLAILKTL